MINQRHKKIKKQFPSSLHLHLHRPTALKRIPTPDYQRQVMRPQLRLGIRCVGVRIARTVQDRAALDSTVETLFAEGETLQGFDLVFFCCAAFYWFILLVLIEEERKKGKRGGEGLRTKQLYPSESPRQHPDGK